jgi:hypothetical protein
METISVLSEMSVDQLIKHCDSNKNELSALEIVLCNRLDIAMDIIKSDQEFSQNH